MVKKTKKNTSRNNNNRLTRYRGGSSNNESNTLSATRLTKDAVGLAAKGTEAILRGATKYTGTQAIARGVVGLASGAAGKIGDGATVVSESAQKGAVKGAEGIGNFKQSVKYSAYSEKTKETAGKVFDTLTGERLIKNEAKAIADTASKAARKISDKTKKAIDKLEKVTSVVGIDKGSVGNFMVEDENCKFDVPSVSKSQIESKTETDVKNKLSKSELFGSDNKFKKYMTDRILKKCREYHDVTKKKPDKYFMRFFNHCANFFDCFNDVTELVYLFNDVIGSDLSFLTDIKNEKGEKDKKNEIDLKVDEKKKELEKFTKQQEERLEEEKKIGESEEETKQRLAKEGKKKGEMDKYIKAKEAKMDELEQNKINLRKQIRNITTVLTKLTETSPTDEQRKKLKSYPKIKDTDNEAIVNIHLKSIEYVLDKNRESYNNIKRTYRNQVTKRENELKKKLNNKILPDIKSKLEKELDDIYSEYQKALENTENKKDSQLLNYLKYNSENIKKNKFLIKYSYAQAEEDKLRKNPEYKLDKFIAELKNALENKTDTKKLKSYIDPTEKNSSFILSEIDSDSKDSGKGKGKGKDEDKDTESMGKVLNEKSKELKKLLAKKKKIDDMGDKQTETEYEDEDGKKGDKKPKEIKQLLEGRIQKLQKEIKKDNEDYKSSASTKDNVGVDLKINILVFFLNNVFIANVKEYAIVNSSKEFTFKDDLSRELSKIIEYNKFKEDIEKLDKDKEFKQKLAKIGDTNFIDNKMFETIKIEKRDNVEEPAFDMNDLYKKLKNNKDVRKNIYDYYKMLMQLEIDIDSGKIKMDDKFEEEKFGPNMYMYIVLGFLGTAMGFELANLSNVRAAMGNT